MAKKNHDNNFNDNELTNIDSITNDRNPILDNDVTNKKFVIDCIEEGTTLRFNQTLESCLKVFVGNASYKFTKYNRIQSTDSMIIQVGNSRGYLPPSWRKFCNHKNKICKIKSFIGATKTNSPTSESWATQLPPIGTAFMYIETSSNKHGIIVFVSWERIDMIQFTNVTIC